MHGPAVVLVPVVLVVVGGSVVVVPAQGVQATSQSFCASCAGREHGQWYGQLDSTKVQSPVGEPCHLQRPESHGAAVVVVGTAVLDV